MIPRNFFLYFILIIENIARFNSENRSELVTATVKILFPDLNNCTSDTTEKFPDDFYNTMNVTYSGGLRIYVTRKLLPDQFKYAPEVSWKNKPECFYTLVMIDHLTRERPNLVFEEFLHWLVVNIPGDDVNKGDVLAEYIGYWPHKDTGERRYLFFALDQPNGTINFNESKISETSDTGRVDFEMYELMRKYELGKPFATNFFLSGFDE